MSGLLDAVVDALGPMPLFDSRVTKHRARAAVEAVAAWMDVQRAYQCREIARLIREEVAPPRPTPEDVIRKALKDPPPPGFAATHALRIATALRDAGMLREQDAIRAERWSS